MQISVPKNLATKFQKPIEKEKGDITVSNREDETEHSMEQMQIENCNSNHHEA